jgi:TRAP-type C4-dicarboxylate transport system substrate-binding protein
MTDRRTILLATTLGVLLLGGTAQATINPERLYLAANGHIPWQSLSDEEQDALREYRGHWNEYDTNRQHRMREGARRYQQLPPEKRRKIKQKHHEYEQLSPQERHRLREEYRRQHK